VGSLLQSDDALSVLDEEWRPWLKVKEDTAESIKFYEVHDRQKQVPPIHTHLSSSDKSPCCSITRPICKNYALLKHVQT
jgi:hypothetical protein